MRISKQNRSMVHAAIIFAGIVATPFLPDDLVPLCVCKAALGGATGGLLAVIFDRFFLDEGPPGK